MLKGNRFLRFLFFLAVSCLLCFCTSPTNKNKGHTDKPDYSSTHLLSSKERKEITNKFLKAHHIPTLPSLPEVEDHSNAHFRRVIDVARRSVILYGVFYVARNEKSSAYMIDYFKKYQLWDDVSPSEKKYLLNNSRSEKENNEMSWRMESLNVLFWALGVFNELPLPVAGCDFSAYKNLPNLDADPLNWIQNAKLRNTEDILNETDLVYRIHWATTEAGLKNHPKPGGFSEDVIYERHYALNWLTMYADNWDEVTTDT